MSNSGCRTVQPIRRLPEASMRARGKVGSALKSKVASVLPCRQLWPSFRCRPYAAHVPARPVHIPPKRRENGRLAMPSVTARSAISAQSLGKPGPERVSMAGQRVNCRSRGRVMPCPKRAIESCPQRGWATATSLRQCCGHFWHTQPAYTSAWLRHPGLRRGLLQQMRQFSPHRLVHSAMNSKIGPRRAGIPSWAVPLQDLAMSRRIPVRETGCSPVESNSTALCGYAARAWIT